MIGKTIPKSANGNAVLIATGPGAVTCSTGNSFLWTINQSNTIGPATRKGIPQKRGEPLSLTLDDGENLWGWFYDELHVIAGTPGPTAV